MAPSGGPLKTAGLQGKRRRVRGSVPFGGRNGHIWLAAAARSTATTGAWPSPLVPRRLARGPRCGDHGPFARPLEEAGLQGKSSGVRGSVPFRGSNGRSTAFADHHGVGYSQGSDKGALAGAGRRRPRLAECQRTRRSPLYAWHRDAERPDRERRRLP
jgi:hypothetical protein